MRATPAEILEPRWWTVLKALAAVPLLGLQWHERTGQHQCTACDAEPDEEADIVASRHAHNCPFRMVVELVAAIQTPGLDTGAYEGQVQHRPGEVPAGAVPFLDMPTMAPFYRLNRYGVPDTRRSYVRVALPGAHVLYNCRQNDGGRVGDAQVDDWELVVPHTPFGDLVVERVRDREMAKGNSPAGALPIGTIAERAENYVITTDPALACLRCGSVTRNLQDIQHRFCPQCKEMYPLITALPGGLH